MERRSHTVYLLTGSNIGDRLYYLEEAFRRLETIVIIDGESAVYETEAWGTDNQPPYLNQVIRIFTNMNPHGLHAMTRRIERDLGRRDKGNLLPRTLDIDILLFGDIAIETESLIIPHPRMAGRRFVLKPLAEIAGGIIHPVTGDTIFKMLASCTDRLAVHKYAAN